MTLFLDPEGGLNNFMTSITYHSMYQITKITSIIIYLGPR